MFSLTTDSITYTEETILNGQWNAATDPTSILSLCQNWIKGQQSFTVHTSGSTGTPKPILITRKQIEASARRSLEFFHLVPGDQVLCPLSLQVIGGKMMVLRSLIGKLPVECIPADRGLTGLRTDRRYDFMPVSPLQLYHILSSDPEKTHLINRIPTILIGGGSVSGALLSLIRAQLTNTLWQSYGMTETVSHIALRQIHPLTEDLYQTLPGTQIATDENGRLKILGEVTNGEWVQTNDLVEIHTSGAFAFKGRMDFVINSGGVKIHTEPLEEQIAEVFRQQQFNRIFFIAGQADEAFGEKVVLFIEGEAFDDESLIRLTEAIKKQVPKFHAPQQICFGAFHYTASGKTDRLATQTALTKKA